MQSVGVVVLLVNQFRPSRQQCLRLNHIATGGGLNEAPEVIVHQIYRSNHQSFLIISYAVDLAALRADLQQPTSFENRPLSPLAPPIVVDHRNGGSKATSTSEGGACAALQTLTAKVDRGLAATTFGLATCRRLLFQ
jgi:hypothetical protein